MALVNPYLAQAVVELSTLVGEERIRAKFQQIYAFLEQVMASNPAHTASLQMTISNIKKKEFSYVKLRKGDGDDKSDFAYSNQKTCSPDGIGRWWKGRQVDLIMEYKPAGSWDEKTKGRIYAGLMWNDNFKERAAEIIKEHNLAGPFDHAYEVRFFVFSPFVL